MIPKSADYKFSTSLTIPFCPHLRLPPTEGLRDAVNDATGTASTEDANWDEDERARTPETWVVMAAAIRGDDATELT